MKQPSSYLKMRVLGAIEGAPGKTSHARIVHVAGLTFTDEDGNPRQFTWRTIQTWLYRYRNHGITGVGVNPRKDKGKARKITPEELMEAINHALPNFHGKRYNKTDVYRYCIEKGLLRKELLAPTTYYRFVREYDLFGKDDGKKRLSFAMQFANQMWQADTMYGPYMADSTGKKKQTYLIAFIDDASRLLCHGEFFFEENVDSLVRAVRAAIYKRGVPEQLYVDNGSIYKSQELTMICARVGCILRHTPVYDGAAKGKIERFFRRVRDQFLNRKLDLSSLEALNRQFFTWTEDDYNSSVHGTTKMKPIDRFMLDYKRIRFLSPMQSNDELFYAETKRKVKKDNTFSFKNVRYETPVDLRNKQITIRYERTTRNCIVVYYKDQRMGEARHLDPVANGLMRMGKKENQ